MPQSQIKLGEIRIAEGLTVAGLSRLAEVNEKTIRDIEKGKRPGSAVIRSRILRGLNKNTRKSKTWEYGEIF